MLLRNSFHIQHIFTGVANTQFQPRPLCFFLVNYLLSVELHRRSGAKRHGIVTYLTVMRRTFLVTVYHATVVQTTLLN